MIFMGDDFSRDESLNGLSYTLDQMGNEINDERAEMLDHDAEIQMLEHIMESGTLQPQDL